MGTSQERIKEVIEVLSGYNKTPGEGITRFSYTKEDTLAREYLIGLCKEIGLKVRVDAVGNIFARLDGQDNELARVMSGSHIDSVKNGGRYDGIVGSVCALEAVRVMIEEGYKPKRPIEVVFFAEEEGSMFKAPTVGSKVLAGKLSADDLKKMEGSDGRSAYETIKAAGYNPDDISKDIIKKGDVKAMVELHIEQSVRLDKEGHIIGIVNGIAGVYWDAVTLRGVPNHAGATPMNLRQDPMSAAASIISEVKDMAKLASNTAVATVGKIEVKPNIANAIPAEVRFTVDIRDISQEAMDEVARRLKEAADKYAMENDVEYQIERQATTLPIKIEEHIIETMVNKAEEIGVDYILMPSGAVHDSNYMAEVTEVGMIFVPSINGRSHAPEEETKIGDIKAGADLLLEVLKELSK